MNFQWVEEAEFISVQVLLALLRCVQNYVEAGVDRCFNDSGIDLQSLIDRCSAHMSNGDVSGCYNLVGDIQAWLLVEQQGSWKRERIGGGTFEGYTISLSRCLSRCKIPRSLFSIRLESCTESRIG